MRGFAVGSFWTVLQTGLGILVVFLMERRVTAQDLLIAFLFALVGTGLFVVVTHLPFWGKASPRAEMVRDSPLNVGGNQLWSSIRTLVHINWKSPTTIGGAPPVEPEKRSGTGRRSTDQRPEPRPLRVTLIPSSGNAPDLRLTVRNDGRADTFSADSRVFARRNTGSEKLGTYHLRWIEGSSSQRLRTGETANLLVAGFEITNWIGGGSLAERIGHITLPEWAADPYHRTKDWDEAIWTMKPKERLPEFGLAITVLGQEADAPETYFYKLEPEKYSGPLRLVPLEGPELD